MEKMVHMESTSLDLFPTPVVEYDIRHLIDVDEINDKVYQLNAEHGHLNYGLFPGAYSSFPTIRSLLDSPQMEMYKPVFEDVMNRYCQHTGLRQHYIDDSWFNYTGNKGSVKLHRHPNISVTLTYYSSFPEGAANLRFVSPIAKAFKQGEVNFATGIDEHNLNQYNQFEYELQIKEGHVYAFPGWLRHWTNESDAGERIMIGINCNPRLQENEYVASKSYKIRKV